MKKEDLIIKWLDNSLNEEELRAFEQLDASSTFKQLDQAIQHFKAPHFDASANYQRLLLQRAREQKIFPWKRMWASAAAVAVICIGLYFSYFQVNSTTFIAHNAELITLQLPDSSEVILNAGSEVSYQEKDWSKQRSLSLKGEAYFNVAKGSSFTVSTSQGTVTVLGTEFNVKARENYFEVTCYEGSVQVNYQNEIVQLAAGKGFRAYEQLTDSQETVDVQPAWIENRSAFKSVPFIEVLHELERQYNVKVEYDTSLNNTLVTTNFTHKNLDTALQAITIPLKLSYLIDGNSVMLKRK
jgi:transmembrane sensor